MLQDGHADLVAMARELMVHADWPLRAAKELQGGHYDLMAPSIAHRLRRRDEQAVAYPPGSAVEIPVAADRSETVSLAVTESVIARSAATRQSPSECACDGDCFAPLAMTGKPDCTGGP